MFVNWDPSRENLDTLKSRITERVQQYRRDYAGYYSSFADAASPAQRGSDPSVVVIHGIGLFGFAKDKKEARITAEFFVNAIQVMAGANALEDRKDEAPTFWQARHPARRGGFKSFHNYVALPRGEAFRIDAGRSRRPSCSACRRRRNSAGRSRWWSAPAAHRPRRPAEAGAEGRASSWRRT
jgi:hypothetical protein